MNEKDNPFDRSGPDSDPAHAAGSIPPELVDLDSRIEEALRADRRVDPDRIGTLASSVFIASVDSLPAPVSPVATYPINAWRRRLSVGVGLAVAASLTLVAWLQFQTVPGSPPPTETPRIATMGSEPAMQAPIDPGFDDFAVGDGFLVSIESPTGSEALLAAVIGGDAEWFDDTSSSTLAVQNVRPVLDSWSIDVIDVEAEIQSILAGPTS